MTTQENPVTQDQIITDGPVGYIIAGPNKVGKLEADWDGEIHSDCDKARGELIEAQRSYPACNYELFELHPVRVTITEATHA